MFTNAIVRQPCPEMTQGLTEAGLGIPEYTRAMDQHSAYVKALESLKLLVQVLEPDSMYPDSTFVEDVALCVPGMAVLTNPGALSRNGERTKMRSILRSNFPIVESIEWPGTLDAGDVMKVDQHFYIGISQRTNEEGARQLSQILESHHNTASFVPLKEMLHLKSCVSYLENNNLLVAGEFITHPAFQSFNRLEVDKDEAYAANSLWINGKVLVPEGFPKTRELIEQEGYETIQLDVSEFRKLDGGLSCLSLRY